MRPFAVLYIGKWEKIKKKQPGEQGASHGLQPTPADNHISGTVVDRLGTTIPK